MASRDHARRHWPIVVTTVLALALTMVPLPASIDAFRPDWVALLMIFWGISVPRSYGPGIAWLIGIVVDVAQGTLLGQHALALSAVVFLAVRFHLLIRVFPTLQLTTTVFALLALYQFLLFWVNGVAGVDAPVIGYWAPVISGAVLWPFLYAALSELQFRVQRSH